MNGFLSMTVVRCCSRRSSCPRLSCYTCCRARGSDTKGAVTAQGFLCTLRIHGVFLVTRAARMGKNRLETEPHPSDQIFPEDQTLFETRNPCVFVKRSVQKNQQHSSANYKLLGSAWQNASTFTVARWPLLSLAAGRWSATFSKGECACVTPTCGFKSHFATVTRNSGVSSATWVTLGALRNVLWMWEGAKTAADWTRERKLQHTGLGSGQWLSDTGQLSRGRFLIATATVSHSSKEGLMSRTGSFTPDKWERECLEICYCGFIKHHVVGCKLSFWKKTMVHKVAANNWHLYLIFYFTKTLPIIQ